MRLRNPFEPYALASRSRLDDRVRSKRFVKEHVRAESIVCRSKWDRLQHVQAKKTSTEIDDDDDYKDVRLEPFGRSSL